MAGDSECCEVDGAGEAGVWCYGPGAVLDVWGRSARIAVQDAWYLIYKLQMCFLRMRFYMWKDSKVHKKHRKKRERELQKLQKKGVTTSKTQQAKGKGK